MASFFNWVVKQSPMPRKVLFFSSSAVYPISAQTPSNNFPLSEELVNFGKTELGIPDMTYGLNVVIYRPFSGFCARGKL